MDRTQIGQWVGERRKLLGLTQSDLGSKLSYTPQAVSLIEQGKSSLLISTLYPLAEVLRCSPEDVLSCNPTPSDEYRIYEYSRERFSSNLRRYRRKLGLKQNDLAAQLGISSRTLRTYEKDKATPSIELVCRFLEIAGIELIDLERE